MIGLITLRTLLQMQLKINLSTKQIELIMIYFDHENRGEINLNDVIGTAQLYYDKWRRRKDDDSLTDKIVIDKLKCRQRRKIYNQKLHEQKLSKSHLLLEVMEALKAASYNLIISKNIKLLSLDRRLIMNSALFQESLVDFDIYLASPKARKALEERYCYDRPGNIDFLLFKNEFLSLGAEVMIQKGQNDLLEAFVYALSGSTSSTATSTSLPQSSSTFEPNDSTTSEAALFADQNLHTR